VLRAQCLVFMVYGLWFRVYGLGLGLTHICIIKTPLGRPDLMIMGFILWSIY
jgi:hypothetical protein